MPSAFNFIPIIIQPIALTVTLVYLVSVTSQWRLPPAVSKAILGGLFTLGALASMAAPVTLAEGLIVDMRNLIIGAAMGLLGPIAGLVTLVGGAITRIAIGGQGMVAGLSAMALAATGGLIWHYAIRTRVRNPNVGFLLLGVMISSHNGAAVLLDPPFRSVFLLQLSPVLFVMNLGGAWLLGRMLERETNLRKKVRELHEAASTDPLTKLLNRRTLIESVERLDRNEDADAGRVMLCFDVDDFKTVNDTYGHAAGDLVLQEICERVTGCLRPVDIFSRIGGDEFVVVLPQVTPATARLVAERCIDAVTCMPFDVEGQFLSITISMGAAWATPDDDFETLLARADGALYRAKAKGRNQVAFSDCFGDQVVLKAAS